MTQRIKDVTGQDIGLYLRRVDTPAGGVVLIQRAEHLGAGTIVLPARAMAQRGGEWVASYDVLAIREAPPLSPNVALEAYLEFWKRLGVSDVNIPLSAFAGAGSGPVETDQEVPDARLEEMVKQRLQASASEGVEPHLVRVSVNQGTVLLEGYQGDTQGRLAAARAAATVPGVKEIVNMLVIRAL